MSYKEAREFFLSPKSYFSGNLPSYFNFKTILLKAENILRQKSLSEILVEGRTLNNESDINYKIMFNKDGKYAWRQLQIIHPILYVDLVNLITEEENWELIKNKFSSKRPCRLGRRDCRRRTHDGVRLAMGGSARQRVRCRAGRTQRLEPAQDIFCFCFTKNHFF